MAQSKKEKAAMLMHFYATALDRDGYMNRENLRDVQTRVSGKIREVQIEECWKVEFKNGYCPTPKQVETLRGLFARVPGETLVLQRSILQTRAKNVQIIEIGPRSGSESPDGERAKKACWACGIPQVTHVDVFTRYGLDTKLTVAQTHKFLERRCDRMTQQQYKKPIRTFDAKPPKKMYYHVPMLECGIDVLFRFREEFGLPWTDEEVQALYEDFQDMGRNPTDVELRLNATVGCDHTRHGKWRKKHILDGRRMECSLMDTVKKPWRAKPGSIKNAFCDDNSSQDGAVVRILMPDENGRYRPTRVYFHLTATAETHNHPSFIYSDGGAPTGVGGQLRDLIAGGRGSQIGATGFGLFVGNLEIPGYEMPWEAGSLKVPSVYESPLKIAINSARGVANYGNCAGFPTNVFVRGAMGMLTKFRKPDGTIGYRYVSHAKPIVYVTGMGRMHAIHQKPKPPKVGDIIFHIGGRKRKIGVGGGTASSKSADPKNTKLDLDSVQRPDAAEEQAIIRVGQRCIERRRKNMVRAVLDLGAGGIGNAGTEILESKDPRHKGGGIIWLNRIPLADVTMNWSEVALNESQEGMLYRIAARDRRAFIQICKSEGCEYAEIGCVTGSGRVVMIDEAHPEVAIVDLEIDKMLKDVGESNLVLEREERLFDQLVIPRELSFSEVFQRRLLRMLAVTSGAWFMKHTDHTVGGRTAAHPDAGPMQLPIRNCTALTLSQLDLYGEAMACGEAILVGLIDSGAMVRMALGRTIMNMITVVTEALTSWTYQANWMYANSGPGEFSRLVDAAEALSKALIYLMQAITGGKDSGSMTAKGMLDLVHKITQTVHAPLTLILTAVAGVPDVSKQATPDLKKRGGKLIHIDLAKGKRRLGGTLLSQVLGQIGDECPDVEDWDLVVRVFNVVQELIKEGKLAAVHNFNGKGLGVAVLEMALAANRGVLVDTVEKGRSAFETYANGELGLILEAVNVNEVKRVLSRASIPHEVIGMVLGIQDPVEFHHNDEVVLQEELATLRKEWEKTSWQMETASDIPDRRMNENCVFQARSGAMEMPAKWKLTYTPEFIDMWKRPMRNRPKAAILREVSTNGDDEMRNTLYLAGFDVYDVKMWDLENGKHDLANFQLIVFAGGFSYGDTLGAGKVWAMKILSNRRLKKMFDAFYARPDTLVLGVCNGCQVISELGWVPKARAAGHEGGLRMQDNKSGRFEHRFVDLGIEKSDSVFCEGMEGSVLGAILAHAQGNFYARQEVIEAIFANGQVAMTYRNHKNDRAVLYPANPNGSCEGIAAVTFNDGRGLAVMPHHERLSIGVVQPSGDMVWQHNWPYVQPHFRKYKASPWLRLSQNAFNWCVRNRRNQVGLVHQRRSSMLVHA